MSLSVGVFAKRLQGREFISNVNSGTPSGGLCLGDGWGLGWGEKAPLILCEKPALHRKDGEVSGS